MMAWGRGRGRQHSNLRHGLSTNVKIGNNSTFSVELRPTSDVKCSTNSHTLNWKEISPLKDVQGMAPYQKDYVPKDQNIPLSQINCNFPQEHQACRASKMSLAKTFHQYPYDCTKLETQVSDERPTMSHLQEMPSFFAKTLSDPTISKPFSFSDCFRKKSGNEKFGLAVDKNHDIDYEIFQQKPLLAPFGSKPFLYSESLNQPATLLETGAKKIWKPNDSMQNNIYQMPKIPGDNQREPCSEMKHFHKDPTALVDNKLHGRSGKTMRKPNEDQFSQTSGQRTWTFGDKERDVLVPALTIDEWMKSRKGGLNKNSESGCSEGTPGSSNSSFSAGQGSLNSSMTQSDVSASCTGMKNSNSVIRGICQSTMKPTDTSNSEASKVSRFHGLKGDKESKDGLHQRLNGISVSESQQSWPKSQSQLRSSINGEMLNIVKSPSVETTGNCSENTRHGVVAPDLSSCTMGLQNPNYILNPTTGMESKWPSILFPSFSFPNGVYPSTDAQQVAAAFQQHLILLHDFQKNMMTASKIATDSTPKSVDPMQNPSPSSDGPNSRPLSAVSSGDSQSVLLVFNSKTSHSDTRALHADQQNFQPEKKSLYGNQALPSQRKDNKGEKTNELSNEDIENILAKFSDLSFEEKPVKQASCQDKSLYDSLSVEENKKVKARTTFDFKSNFPTEDEENWNDGINLDSMCLPHRKFDHRQDLFASENHFSSAAPHRQKSLTVDEIQSSATLENDKPMEPMLSDKKINSILKQVPNLISKSSKLHCENNSVSKEGNQPVFRRRPLRKPVTLMRCKQSANMLKSEEADTAHNEPTFQFLKSNQVLPESNETYIRPSRMLSRQFWSKNDGNEEVEQSERLVNLDNSQTDDRNERTRRKPENPARLMKTALSEIKKVDRSRSVSPRKMSSRQHSHFQKFTGFYDLDVPQIKQTAPQEKSNAQTLFQQYEKKIQESTQLKPHIVRNAALDLSPIPSLPSCPEQIRRIAVSKKTNMSVCKRPKALTLKNALETQKTHAKYPPVCNSRTDSASSGLTSFSLPSMPSLSSTKSMPKKQCSDK
ncbi:hypothetical protein ElyMa_006812300 [Elysia marginata]|uniref:Uncharacterized protein n=1 Tax=Elysia marginata TaxID=1093978 RepID=A0AAV4J506_9GAST|nr:hypothetical protein ElyMa_006812300 [Elysia marginata]